MCFTAGGGRVLLAFETMPLREICEKEAEAIDALGSDVAMYLRRRLADLRAAASMEDLMAGRPRQSPDRSKLLLDLVAGQVLVCEPNHRVRPREKAGVPDWPRISRVKIVAIQYGDE
jgi:hypothetical protein